MQTDTRFSAFRETVFCPPPPPGPAEEAHVSWCWGRLHAGRGQGLGAREAVSLSMTTATHVKRGAALGDLGERQWHVPAALRRGSLTVPSLSGCFRRGCEAKRSQSPCSGQKGAKVCIGTEALEQPCHSDPPKLLRDSRAPPWTGSSRGSGEGLVFLRTQMPLPLQYGSSVLLQELPGQALRLQVKAFHRVTRSSVLTSLWNSRWQCRTSGLGMLDEPLI